MTFRSTTIKKLRTTTIVLSSVVLCAFHHSTYADDLSFHHAVINATPPGIKVTAAYMKIHNDTQKNITLISAKGDISDHIELHQHSMKNGLMSMQKVESITVPAMTDTVLSPGGYHIMIMNLEKAVKEKSQHNITLTFSNGLEKNITFTAYKPGTHKTKANTEHHHHHSNNDEAEATHEHKKHHH